SEAASKAPHTDDRPGGKASLGHNRPTAIRNVPDPSAVVWTARAASTRAKKGMKKPCSSASRNRASPAPHSTRSFRVMCASSVVYTAFILVLYRLSVCIYRPTVGFVNFARSVVKQQHRREATISSILTVARAAFGTRGFAATTIESIAEDCGIAKGAVYHHFTSKEALFTAVMEAVQV